MHINIRSLLAKINIIRDYILGKNTDIVGITETWLTPNIADDFLIINGYKLIKRDRNEGRGGGILVYIKAELRHRVASNFLPNGEVAGRASHAVRRALFEEPRIV